MSEEPDILNIADSDREVYEKIVKDKLGPFKGKDNKHVFMVAISYGLKFGKRTPLNSKKYGFIRREYLSKEELSIIKAIAVNEGQSLDILLDKAELYKIAEEYANTGIKLLKKEIYGEIKGIYGDYYKRLSSELLEHLEKFDLKSMIN